MRQIYLELIELINSPSIWNDSLIARVQSLHHHQNERAQETLSSLSERRLANLMIHPGRKLRLFRQHILQTS
jgi:hypothetical protein